MLCMGFVRMRQNPRMKEEAIDLLKELKNLKKRSSDGRILVQWRALRRVSQVFVFVSIKS